MKENTKRGRTLVFNKKRIENAAEWVRWMEEHCLASAGPHPSIVGMRRQFWGRSALIVKAGSYAYLMANEDHGQTMPWERRAS